MYNLNNTLLSNLQEYVNCTEDPKNSWLKKVICALTRLKMPLLWGTAEDNDQILLLEINSTV